MADDDDATPPGPPWRPLIGLVVLVAAGVGVWYIVQQLHKSAAMQDCLASGRTNCAPVTAR